MYVSTVPRFLRFLFCGLLLGLRIFTNADAWQSETLTNWPQWRGPQADGVASGGPYPNKWSDRENVAWKFEIGGIGASTPVIWQDRIFLTGAQDGKNTVWCVDREGKQQWKQTLGDETPARNRKASGSNSSPITDGQHVWVYFKSGELACLDLNGRVVWNQNLQERYGKDTLWWDLGTSPVLTDDCIVVACMQSGPSYLVALEKENGKEVWKRDRLLDAPNESAQSYTTPLVVREGDRETLIVLGADHVTAHDAKTGEQRWIVRGLNPQQQGNWRSISSPVVADGMVVVPYGRGSSLTAIKLGGSGDVTDSQVAWSHAGPSADVPTPVVHEGKIYVCTDRGQVIVYELESGKKLQELQLPRKRDAYSASPVLGSGHLYLANEDGTVFVVKLGETLELVGENSMNDFMVASPVMCDGRVYLRTDKYLFCIADGTEQRSSDLK